MKKVPMSIKEFEILRGQRCGICKHCKGIVWGDMDEFSKNHFCETCRDNSAVGMAQAMRDGLVNITQTDFVFVK